MEASLPPREIPGGVGTCRLGFSDIGVYGGDVSEGGLMRKMGDESMMGGGRGRKGTVVYKC